MAVSSRVRFFSQPIEASHAPLYCGIRGGDKRRVTPQAFHQLLHLLGREGAERISRRTRSIALSPDGKLLATYGRLWQRLAVMTPVKIGPKGRYLATRARQKQWVALYYLSGITDVKIEP